MRRTYLSAALGDCGREFLDRALAWLHFGGDTGVYRDVGYVLFELREIIYSLIQSFPEGLSG
jgi:hypothetical protein